MRLVTVLAGAMLVVTLAMVAGATAVPGVLSEPEEDVRPSHLTLRESTINATEVQGETVTLAIDSRLDHRGGTARNVTVETRAIDADTGLVATTRRQSIGNVSGEQEVSVLTNLSVERAGDYRIETIVFADDERTASGRTTVRNVDALTPEYAKSSVSFHRFENANVPLRAISYRIVDVQNNQTTLNVSVFLTNRGDGPAGNLELRLRARQAESNVIADETTIRVGEIRPGRTTTASAEMTVPDGYNYWLDGILQSDDVIVATESAPANLDPTETLSVNETRRDVGFESGDFAEEERPDPEPETEMATRGNSGPGFTIAGALAGVLVIALILTRRQL